MAGKNKSILKRLKHAAVIAFGGVALLGGGMVAEKALTPAVSVQLPQGDGHPVLVIPGFMTGDFYMSSLRSNIAQQGYKVYRWGQGVNLGASQHDAQGLEVRLKEISAENGGRKVSIVGYSLGGVYGRELAKKYPDLVRDVVTLGAPFGLRDKSGAPDEALARIHGYYGLPAKDDVAQPPAVPTTSVYSKDDDIVNWRTSLNAPSASSENIAVQGGHIRLPFNEQAASVVLNRLAQPEGKWQPLWTGVLKP